MLNSKQRAALRSMANLLEPILFIGKAGVTASAINLADEALLSRELIKGSVQQNSPQDAKQALEQICNVLQAQPVAVSGRKFVIYRKNDKNPVIKI